MPLRLPAAELMRIGDVRMSVIAIVLKKESYSSGSLVKLHRALGIPLREIKDKWVNHNPIFEKEIFQEGYNAHAAVIRAVLKLVDQEQLKAEFYEIPRGERYAGNTRLDTWRIDGALIKEILLRADEEIERHLSG